MDSPLNASAKSAGALMSSSSFEIPPYQREYSWSDDEVSEFWSDLSSSLGDEPYFLGLVILTDEDGRKQVVDGQQRILTITLLAAALYHEATERGRKALAERIQADFLRSIDYETDETKPRVVLSDSTDNATLQRILAGTNLAKPTSGNKDEEDSLSKRMKKAFLFLREELRKDLASDPFKRLGAWTDFLTNYVYFAVFVHPDAGSAYRVYEVINTRGRELTTADLLKNYVLSQTPKSKRDSRYDAWQAIAKQFSPIGDNSFVQYIRHVVTVEGGHILPKDLFDFLAERKKHGTRTPPNPERLMVLLQENLPLYTQMIDPSLDGPADPEALKIFDALNSLAVISVRPILLAMSAVPDGLEGMRYILRLVVRRIVVGNLGTGNVERRFGEAALKVRTTQNWHSIISDLDELNPTRDEFVDQLMKRSFNKQVLEFIRNSIIGKEMTPDKRGHLHFIRPRHATEWHEFPDEDAAFWATTIGNTILSTQERRPNGANSWEGFKEVLLPIAAIGEWSKELRVLDVWDASAVEEIGERLARVAGDVWYEN